MGKKEKVEIVYSLFEPSVRDMFADYPELKEYIEFSYLTQREVRLCWFIGNRTSPFFNKPKDEKIRLAVQQVYRGASQSRKEVIEMLKGNIPDKIKSGIKRMSTFRPSVRLRSRLINEYIFESLQDIINISAEEKAVMDLEEKKKYADLMIKVSTELPNVIRQMEVGHGINYSMNKDGEKVSISINDIMDKLD